MALSKFKNISGRWINRSEIEPQNGMDIITTIDVKMQDIAESALLRQAEKSNPEWATAVLMEVSTGEIKAIANQSIAHAPVFYQLGTRCLVVLSAPRASVMPFDISQQPV